MASRLVGVLAGLAVVGLAAGVICGLGVVAVSVTGSQLLFGSVEWGALLGRMLGLVAVAGVAAGALVLVDDGARRG